MMPDLRKGKFYCQAHDVAHRNHRDHANQAKPETLPETCMQTLISDVPHAKQHRWNQGDDHCYHGTFQVDGVTHMAAAFRHRVRRESEGVECLVGAAQPRPTAFRLMLLKPAFQSFQNPSFIFYLSSFLRHIPSFLSFSNASRMIC